MAAKATAPAKPNYGARQSRPPRTALPPAPPPPAPPGPLRFSSASDEPEAREPLFYIDDTEYTIPVDPPSSIALEALHIIGVGGGSPTAQMVAQDYVMTQMLGADGWAALRACKTVKKQELKHLITVISERANAALEDEDGPNL